MVGVGIIELSVIGLIVLALLAFLGLDPGAGRAPVTGGTRVRVRRSRLGVERDRYAAAWTGCDELHAGGGW